MLTEKYLRIKDKICVMYGEFINERYADTGYKLRWIRSIEKQIKRDYAELNQLWKKTDIDKKGDIEIDELLEKISWIKAGLKNFMEYRNEDIEGVLWLDTERIVKDLQAKENRIEKELRESIRQLWYEVEWEWYLKNKDSKQL